MRTFALSIVILLGAWHGWWVVWVPALVWYAVYNHGALLVAAILCVDAYYGGFAALPWQTCIAFVIVALFAYLRPRLYATVS
jgi:hypothetical protein